MPEPLRNFKHYKVELEVVTPIHIGTGEEVHKSEYIIDSKNNLIGLIDLSKLDPAQIDLITLCAIENKPLSEKKFKRNVSRWLEIKNGGKLRNLRLNLSNLNKPFIPGSSIKGAIRSILFSASLNRNNSNIRPEDIKTNKKYGDETKFIKIVFGEDPKSDLLRGLRIGDFMFPNNSTKVFDSIGKTAKKGDNGNKHMASNNGMRIYLEAFKKGIKASSIISVNEQDFTLQDILAKINDFYKQHRNHEKERLEVFNGSRPYIDSFDKLTDLQENQCLLRFGFGTGYLTKTGSWINNRSIVSKWDYEKITSKLNGKGKYSLNKRPFPSSRRLINNCPMGIAKLTFKDLENSDESIQKLKEEQVNFFLSKSDSDHQTKPKIKSWPPEEPPIDWKNVKKKGARMYAKVTSINGKQVQVELHALNMPKGKQKFTYPAGFAIGSILKVDVKSNARGKQFQIQRANIEVLYKPQ